MNFTDIKPMQSLGANTLTRATLDGGDVLLIGLKSAYAEKPRYVKHIREQYEKSSVLEQNSLLKMTQFVETGPQSPCIVVQLPACRSFADYVKEEHSVTERREFIMRMAAALDAMHSAGMVHGLLCPDLVVVSKQGDVPGIVPFRPIYTDELLSQRGVSRYVAPEAEDGTVAIDARADIYALGQMMKDLKLDTDYAHVVEGCTGFGRSERYLDIEAMLADFNGRRNTNGKPIHIPMGVILFVLLLLIVGGVALTYNRWIPYLHLSDAQATDTVPGFTSGAGGKTGAAADGSYGMQAPADTSIKRKAATGGAMHYSGELAFLNDMMPQVRIDMDKVIAPILGPDFSEADTQRIIAANNRRIRKYYKGLKKTLPSQSPEVLAAFDAEFAKIVKDKKQACGYDNIKKSSNNE